MATIYEGTQREQDLVDERIDPEILRALGLDDVVDLDYSEYKTLLKERLAANRMNTDQEAREDTAKLDEKILNEFRRVRAETGRFRVKNDRISFQKMLPGDSGGALTPNITPVTPPEEEQTVQPQPEQGLNEFLSSVVAPSLTRIEASLLSILENMTGQQKAEEKAASKARVQGEKAKKREKENKFEGLGNAMKKAGDVAKKVFSPLSEIFGMIFNFLSNVLTGFLVLKVLDWIKNPENLFIDIGNMFINFLNSVLRTAHEIAFLPINLFVDGLNNGLNIFENAINDTIGKIPGIPELDLPEVPKPKPIEFPLIPYPEPKEEKEKKQEKQPPVPASAMSEGGVVNKYYQIMADGGQVRTDTGEKVTGAGPDTQLVALQPGEFVMSKGAVDTFGVDTMMGMNSEGGGTNIPRMARVQSVGGVQAMQGGGMVGDQQPPQRAEFPNTRRGGADFARAMKDYKVSISNADPKAQVEPKESVTGKKKATKGSYGSDHLKSYAMKNGITDPTELAMFMAQMSHESGSFRYAEEIHDGSDYEGSSILGNNQPGDGKRYKGRGYIQLTGRWNYGHYGKKVGADLINNPQLAADPDVAAAVAVAYYMERVDRDAARRGDVKSVTYAINGGYNGLEDRQRRFDQYMKGETPAGEVKGTASEGDVKPQQESQVSAMPGQTDTQYEKTESDTSIPMVSPGPVMSDDSGMKKPTYGNGPIKIDEMKVSSPVKTPPPPPKKSGKGQVPVLAPKPPTGGSSGTSNSGSTAPMFSPLDETNPELIVVKAIYNIVG